MTKYELLKLKKQILKEVQRRKRINELLETELVQEFIKLSDVKAEPLDSENIREILFFILNNFTIKETNGIYVCIGTYYTDCDISYEETTYYTRETDFDNEYAEYRTYCDIEDRTMKTAYLKPFMSSQVLSSEFERNNIVLNPHNSSKNNNGYAEVREKFFMTMIEQGQAKAKKLILNEYPRM